MSFTQSSTRLKLVCYVGNIEDITLDVRTFVGNKSLSLGVSDRIYLNIEQPRTGVVQQLTASSSASGADWSAGKIVFSFPGTGALAAAGSYDISFIVVKGVEVITLAGGRIEVRYRPGFPHPA
jgi:hypothetical protein